MTLYELIDAAVTTHERRADGITAPILARTVAGAITELASAARRSTSRHPTPGGPRATRALGARPRRVPRGAQG